MARKSFGFFCTYHLAPLFAQTPASMHLDIFSALEGDEDLLIYAQRGSGKSTILGAFLLWLKLARGIRLGALFSETDDQTKKLFNDVKVPALNTSGRFGRLHADFGAEMQVKTVNTHEFFFADGTGFVGTGSGSSIRGIKIEGQRPQILVIDDLENLKTVATLGQRDDTWAWYTRDVLPILDPGGRTIVVGTLLHEDSFMCRCEASKSFRVIRHKAILQEATNQDLWEQWRAVYSDDGEEAAMSFYEAHRAAMDEGAEVAWPERQPYAELQIKRRKMGSTAFLMEYQNELVASENQVIPPEHIVDFHGNVELENGKGVTYLVSERGKVVKLSDCVLYMAVDPAISQKNSADYFALGVLAAHPDGSRWLLDLVHDRLPFSEQVSTIVDTFLAWRERVGDAIVALGIETVMYQQALKQAVDTEARKRHVAIPTRELKPIQDKLLRLTSVQPQFEQGMVHIQKEKHAVAVHELTGWTRDGKIKPAHDDAQDVVVYCLKLADQPTGGFLSFHH